MNLKVIAKLGDIPNGAEVTKINGRKKYQVQRRIVIHYENLPRPITHNADKSCAFLTDGSGRINAFGVDAEVVWHTNLGALNDLELGGISETGDLL